MKLDNVKLIGTGTYLTLGSNKVLIDIEKLNICKIIQDCSADNIESALSYAYDNPPHFKDADVSAKAGKREELYKKTKSANLEDVLIDGCAFCRERSILLHILLAQLGVNSEIHTGTDKASNRHAFVVYKQDKESKVLDPMNYKELKKTEDYSKYDQDLKIQKLVEPVTGSL